jgi:hypothetical protein
MMIANDDRLKKREIMTTIPGNLVAFLSPQHAQDFL